MEIKGRKIGSGNPVYVVAEIGINHNGDPNKALQLIKVAADAGCDAVKFQKRSIPSSIPKHMWDISKETPWGTISYLEYKRRVEFDTSTYKFLASEARSNGLHIGVSIWDTYSAHWASDEVPMDFLKIPSAHISNEPIVRNTAISGLPFFWSTGMHEIHEILRTQRWLNEFGFENWGVFHCNSSYPADTSELDLRVIPAWQDWLPFQKHPIGYSGHETGLAPTIAAVALGASMVERHITLDRSDWGSDQAASVEPQGLRKLVRDIRTVERALGNSHKTLYPNELKKKQSLSLT